MATIPFRNAILHFVMLLIVLRLTPASASSNPHGTAMQGESEAQPASEPGFAVKLGQSATFGPGNCVTLSRTLHGTCLLSTKCALQNISDTEFSFVCFNPNTSLPHALHSFGRGGFEQEEDFDTGVRCQRCATVSVAFETGGTLVQNALKALPDEILPESALRTSSAASLPASEASSDAIESEPMKTVRIPEKTSLDSAPKGVKIITMDPAQASYYGPSSCIAAFRAPSGVCVIETRCEKEALAKFNMGFTCLEKSGSYAKYLFGKGLFYPEEIYDTRLQCEACLGIGEDEAGEKSTAKSKKFGQEELNGLREQMKQLSDQIRALSGEDGELDDSSAFDCEAGVDKWQMGWSDAKKDYCCKSVGTGCTCKLFNCSTAVDEWERGWSDLKKECCCKDAGIGCPKEKEEKRMIEEKKNDEEKGDSESSEKASIRAPLPAPVLIPTSKKGEEPAPAPLPAPELVPTSKKGEEPLPAPEVVPTSKKGEEPAPAHELVQTSDKLESLLSSDTYVSLDEDTPVILHHRQQSETMPDLRDALRIAAR